jgi:hypothetical protein
MMTNKTLFRYYIILESSICTPLESNQFIFQSYKYELINLYFWLFFPIPIIIASKKSKILIKQKKLFIIISFICY